MRSQGRNVRRVVITGIGVFASVGKDSETFFQNLLGARAAFLEWLMLPGGQTAGQATTPELQQAIPDLFRPRLPALTSGDIVDGESREVDE